MLLFEIFFGGLSCFSILIKKRDVLKQPDVAGSADLGLPVMVFPANAKQTSSNEEPSDPDLLRVPVLPNHFLAAVFQTSNFRPCV